MAQDPRRPHIQFFVDTYGNRMEGVVGRVMDPETGQPLIAGQPVISASSPEAINARALAEFMRQPLLPQIPATPRRKR